MIIEKGICPKCKGLREISMPCYNHPSFYEVTCPLCNGLGLIIVKTTEEIKPDSKKKKSEKTK